MLKNSHKAVNKEKLKLAIVEESFDDSSGTQHYTVKNIPEKVEDLTKSALLTLQGALDRTDKTGLPDKVAVEAAKFVVSAGKIKDTDEYKKMLSSFRQMIVSSRKKGNVKEAEIKTEESDSI